MDKLPSEIWLHIFDYTHHQYTLPCGSYIKYGPMALTTISLVCSAWRSLAEVLLYRNIRITFEYSGDLSSTSKTMLRNLRKHSHCYEFVTELTLFSLAKADERIDLRITDILRTIPRLRSLHLNQILSTNLSRNIFDQISSLIAIRELTASCSFNILDMITFMSADSRDSFNLFTSIKVTCPNPLTTKFLQFQGGDVVWKLERLGVDIDCNPDALHEMLRWLKALKHIHFEIRLNRCMYADDYTTTSIQRLLNLHSESLEHIETAGYYHDDTDVLLDLSTFSALTFLQMNFQEVFQSDPEVAVSKICAPRLATLFIDMTLETCEDWNMEKFEQSHADWILKFATSYRQTHPRGALRTIHVDYQWSFNTGYQFLPMETPWPNAGLEALAPVLQELGIALTWPLPSWDKKDWSGPKRQELLNSNRSWIDWMDENVRGRY